MGSANRLGTGKATQIKDLRAGLRAAADTRAPKPPKPAKAVKRESDEERAVKAEKHALAQHQTSLLKNDNPKKPYMRPGEHVERKGGAGMFLLQLVLVVAAAGGIAWALDPTLVPQEWTDKAREFVGQYIKI